ncbi:MAG TPA: RNA-protein complex protein Nop10 [Thermoplasmata archaeon]|nr:RNA-protein complex protein Nop10 [Thermoplasmata archaeon]HIH98174.1 RNA-protein complex protein Nop10 [Thermoplasmata archaeon]
MRQLKRCPKCREYTLKVTCPKCKVRTEQAAPPKFSPEDRWGKYRRKLEQMSGVK